MTIKSLTARAAAAVLSLAAMTLPTTAGAATAKAGVSHAGVEAATTKPSGLGGEGRSAPALGLTLPAGSKSLRAASSGTTTANIAAQYYGSVSNPAHPIVGTAATADGGGYWLVGSTGTVYAFGDATNYGSITGKLTAPIVDILADSATGGYWLVGSDGNVYGFNAPSFGSLVGHRLAQPVVGGASTNDSKGYWLVARDGGIFAFGDAAFFGSTGRVRLNKPIVGMAADPATGGYWFVASDGGIFAFNAGFFGSTGAVHLAKPVVAMAASPDGGGYWLVASDGGIFAFGDAHFYGSAGGTKLAHPIVGMTSNPAVDGYWFVASGGGVFAYGTATSPASQPAPATTTPQTSPTTTVVPTQTGTSQNWIGYVDVGKTFTSVSGSWVVPTATCNSTDTLASIWVGLDGVEDNSVEQLGTTVGCSDGSAYYYPWWEMYPDPSRELPAQDTVRPGDVIAASVTSSDGVNFTLTQADTTRNWTFTTTQVLASPAPRSSAEWIVESPEILSGNSAEIAPLTDFSTTAISSARATAVGGSPVQINGFTNYDLAAYNYDTSPSSLKASASALDSTGTAFTVTWAGQ